MKPVILPGKNIAIQDVLKSFERAPPKEIASQSNVIRFFLKEVFS